MESYEIGHKITINIEMGIEDGEIRIKTNEKENLIEKYNKIDNTMKMIIVKSSNLILMN